LQKKAILVELAGGVLPRIGNDMWASRTVAPKLITQPAADEFAAAFAPPPTFDPYRRGTPAAVSMSFGV